jgi:hypothetical protein
LRDADIAPVEGVPVGCYYKGRSTEYPTLEDAVKALKDWNANFAEIVELSEQGVVPHASYRRNGGKWELIARNEPWRN